MSATPIPSLILNDGHAIPLLGFGGDQIPPEQTQVTIALEAGLACGQDLGGELADGDPQGQR